MWPFTYMVNPLPSFTSWKIPSYILLTFYPWTFVLTLVQQRHLDLVCLAHLKLV